MLLADAPHKAEVFTGRTPGELARHDIRVALRRGAGPGDHPDRLSGGDQQPYHPGVLRLVADVQHAASVRRRQGELVENARGQITAEPYHRLARQLGEVDLGRVSDPERGRNKDGEGLPAQHHRTECGVRHRAEDEAEVELAGNQRLDLLAGPHLGQLHPGPGLQLEQLPEGFRQHPEGGRAGVADPDGAGREELAAARWLRSYHRRRVVRLPDRGLRFAQEERTSGGKADRVAVAVKQGDVQLSFQPLNLLGE